MGSCSQQTAEVGGQDDLEAAPHTVGVCSLSTQLCESAQHSQVRGYERPCAACRVGASDAQPGCPTAAVRRCWQNKFHQSFRQGWSEKHPLGFPQTQPGFYDGRQGRGWGGQQQVQRLGQELGEVSTRPQLINSIPDVLKLKLLRLNPKKSFAL